MHIIHIAAELAPIAKVGGLADVVLGLSREQSWKGNQVDIIIPKYDCIDLTDIHDMRILYENLTSYFEGDAFSNTVWVGTVEGLRVYFIEPHHPRHLFDRGCFYGSVDDVDRFLYFSRTALEFLFKKRIEPDLLHLHDWHVAVIAPLMIDMYAKLGYSKPKLVLTMHNMEYQGKCLPADLDKIGLKGVNYLTEEKLQDSERPDLINLLKGGIVYSNFVTTVSPNYAREVLRPAEGRGLDKTLRKYQHKFEGILNGLDYSYWNPEIDRYLPIHYSSGEMQGDQNGLEKKKEIKRLLCQKLGLAFTDAPLVGCVTRLVPQKGIDLIKNAIQYTIEKNGHFVLLATSPISAITEEFEALKQKHKGDGRLHISLDSQEVLAHLIFAGSDMIIVPSLFEPCGLTQMIALKYGAIPLVRHTGGLADTVFDVDNAEVPEEMRNGYTFHEPTQKAIESAMSRAFHCWHKQPDRWHKLMKQNMAIDLSWNRSSDRYLEIYKRL